MHLSSASNAGGGSSACPKLAKAAKECVEADCRFRNRRFLSDNGRFETMLASPLADIMLSAGKMADMPNRGRLSGRSLPKPRKLGRKNAERSLEELLLSVPLWSFPIN